MTYPVRNVFKSRMFTICPDFVPDILKPFIIFAPIPMN